MKKCGWNWGHSFTENWISCRKIVKHKRLKVSNENYFYGKQFSPFKWKLGELLNCEQYPLWMILIYIQSHRFMTLPFLVRCVRIKFCLITFEHKFFPYTQHVLRKIFNLKMYLYLFLSHDLSPKEWNWNSDWNVNFEYSVYKKIHIFLC